MPYAIVRSHSCSTRSAKLARSLLPPTAAKPSVRPQVNGLRKNRCGRTVACRPPRYRTPAGPSADGRSRNSQARGLGLRQRRLRLARLRRATARTRHAGGRQAADLDRQADQHELSATARHGPIMLSRPIGAIGSPPITPNSDSIPRSRQGSRRFCRSMMPFVRSWNRSSPRS